jgi:amino acid transporter
MSSTGSDTQSSAVGSSAAQLPRQLNLRDLVLAQVLTVVGSAWVGIAAGLGHAQTVVWLLAFGTFYLPMAAAVYYLNREMPLEGGLYVWSRLAFGDTRRLSRRLEHLGLRALHHRHDPVSDPQ